MSETDLCGLAMDEWNGETGLPAYVYALGRVELRVPSIALEMELTRALEHGGTPGATDGERMHALLRRREYRYLARHACWVLTVGGEDSHVLVPGDPADLELLIEALAAPEDTLHGVIGTRDPAALPEEGSGLPGHMVVVEQLFPLRLSELAPASPAGAEAARQVLARAAREGATDGDRALSYLAARCPRLHEIVAEEVARGASLAGVEDRPFGSGARRVREVLFTFTGAQDGERRYMARVDVTEPWPFLLSDPAPVSEPS